MSEELNNNNSSNIILNEAVEILNILDTLITVELPIDSNVLPNIEPINQPIIEPTQGEQYPELPPSPPNTDANPDPVLIEKTVEEKEKELIIVLNQNSYSYDVP
jgi:hypothetical protein